MGEGARTKAAGRLTRLTDEEVRRLVSVVGLWYHWRQQVEGAPELLKGGAGS
jgi:hypothetical protein